MQDSLSARPPYKAIEGNAAVAIRPPVRLNCLSHIRQCMLEPIAACTNRRHYDTARNYSAECIERFTYGPSGAPDPSGQASWRTTDGSHYCRADGHQHVIDVMQVIQPEIDDHYTRRQPHILIGYKVCQKIPVHIL